jgi:murein DD-endopeptidase MepM/ murein hydrolase activator NlpD
MRLRTFLMNRTPKLTPARLAVAGGGMVAVVALGTTSAFAAGEGHAEGDFLAKSASAGVTAEVQKQAAGQRAAAEKAAARAESKAKAERAEQAKSHEKAVAARKDRAARAGSWVTPTTGYTLGAGFNKPGKHWINKHSGQDFVVNSGTTVRAAHAGTVVTAGWGGAYGNNIVIKHGSHLYTQYGHLSKIGVHVGEHVNTAEKIGLSGSTGNSTGPHLHFEVRTTAVYGSAVEPLHFLRAHGVTP